MNNRIKGKAGEDIVCDYLKKLGYEIIDRNFSTQFGEIDIVAAEDGCLVFIEVKARKNNDFGMPSEAVGYRKQQTISRVASQYVQKYRHHDAQIRFDVAELTVDSGEINLIKNAFDSYVRY